MEENKKQEDTIRMLRSNHFVQEYLEQRGVAEEIKRNPRFQSIVWHISVMLKREGIDFTEKKAVEWIQDNILIGKEGKEIMYVISTKDGYYPSQIMPSAPQFVKYFYDQEGMKRIVKEVRNGKEEEETILIFSRYNEDGIEEWQRIEEKHCISTIQRVENRPELRVIEEYDKEREKILGVRYEKRFFWMGLEDFAPNLIEVDPLGVQPLFQYKLPPFYVPFSITDM